MGGKILVVVHQTASGPGRVARELRALGFGLETCRPYAGDPLPRNMDPYAAAIIFGGTMSANDVSLDFIRAELDWIPAALESGKPFLGICLGAQLLARALGARVEPHARGHHEIGFHPIRPAGDDRSLFDSPLNVYQWHGEGFSLPRSAQLLAVGDIFENQAFRYRSAVGVQFHPEVTPKIMVGWTRRSPDHLALPAAQPLQAHFAGVRRHNPGVVRWLRRFLKAWAPPAGPPQAAVG